LALQAKCGYLALLLNPDIAIRQQLTQSLDRRRRRRRVKQKDVLKLFHNPQLLNVRVGHFAPADPHHLSCGSSEIAAKCLPDSRPA
jgi:hypothetical protein